VFEREYVVALTSLEKKAKKDIQKYLDTLPGMVPYVAAQVFLVNFGGHAIPVDDTLAELLKAEEIVDPQATVAEIAGFLEKHVKAEDAVGVHQQLRHWADTHPEAKKIAKPSRG